jgi:hypothetical protein
LFVDFTKLTPASKAEKAISQLLGTLTYESLTEDLMGLNIVATLKSMHPPPDIKTLDEFTLSVKVVEGSPLPYLGYVEVSISVTFQSDNMMVLLLVVPDFIKLTPASKAEKAISQLWGTLTCESLTEDLIGLNMFVPITTGTDLL